MKTAVQRHSLKELALRHVMARIQKEHWTSEAERTHMDLIDAMQSEGIDKVACEVEYGGVTGVVAPSIGEPQCYVSVKKEDKPKLLKWLKKSGLGGIVKRDVHPRTLSSAVAEYASEGGEVPEWVKVHYKPSLTLNGIGAFQAGNKE